MIKKATFLIAAVAVAIFGMTQIASAQHHYSGSQWGGRGHYDVVPHTTTHTDIVRHGNHFDAVPHTTTHLDRAWHNPYQQSYRPSSFQQSYRPSAFSRYAAPSRLVPHTTTHTDFVRHGNHLDAVPHTTTHFHRAPTYSRSYFGRW